MHCVSHKAYRNGSFVEHVTVGSTSSVWRKSKKLANSKSSYNNAGLFLANG